MENKMKFEITTGTILKIILAIFAVWFLYTVREIVFLLFIVLIIVIALDPLINRMSKYIPRLLALLIFSLAILGILTAIGFLIIPPVVNQLGQISIDLPFYLNKFGPIYQNFQGSIANYQESLFSASSQLGKLSSGIFSTTIGFISGIIGVFTVLVLTFYMLLEKNAIRIFLEQIIPLEHKEKIFELVKKIGLKMGSWLRGQILLMVMIGILDWIALTALGVPFALTLAVWGGLTEVIPYVGPWLGLIPAAIIAFTISPLAGLLVIIIYVGIQQLEAQVLAPKVMGRAVGLSPVIIILAILIGAKLEGILGIIIAVPVAAAISVILQEWPELKKLKTNS